MQSDKKRSSSKLFKGKPSLLCTNFTGQPFLRNNPAGQKYLARLEKKHGQGKALTILAHKLARAVYYMLKRGTAFDMAQFLSS